MDWPSCPLFLRMDFRLPEPRLPPASPPSRSLQTIASQISLFSPILKIFRIVRIHPGKCTDCSLSENRTGKGKSGFPAHWSIRCDVSYTRCEIFHRSSAPGSEVGKNVNQRNTLFPIPYLVVPVKEISAKKMGRGVASLDIREIPVPLHLFSTSLSTEKVERFATLPNQGLFGFHRQEHPEAQEQDDEPG